MLDTPVVTGGDQIDRPGYYLTPAIFADVTDNMTIEELAEVIRNAATPDQAASTIEGTIKERLQEGRVPETIGVRFRYDDRTGIIRFF